MSQGSLWWLSCILDVIGVVKSALEPADVPAGNGAKAHKKQVLVLVDESLHELKLTLTDKFVHKRRYNKSPVLVIKGVKVMASSGAVSLSSLPSSTLKVSRYVLSSSSNRATV
jgi:hypothetical protein